MDPITPTTATCCSLQLLPVWPASRGPRARAQYAIPTISSLLRRTREFELRCSKRYDDTDLLLEEILGFPLGSERSNR